MTQTKLLSLLNKWMIPGLGVKLSQHISFSIILRIGIFRSFMIIHWDKCHRTLLINLMIDKPTLFQIMAWCHPVPQISAFSLRRKCGWEYSDRNAKKSPHSYMGKNVEKNAEEMRMGVFGQERGEISAFLYQSINQSINQVDWLIDWLIVIIWKKCGGNAEKMRMGVFGQEYGEISAFQP